MRFLLLLTSLLFFNTSQAQEFFGLIKYKAPEGWQKQIKEHIITYTGSTPETNIPLDIVLYESQAAAPRPDSSFKAEWARVHSSLGNPLPPYAKRMMTGSGLPVWINVGVSVEINYEHQKRYSQLAVFIIGKQLQAVQFISVKPTDFKVLRPFIDEFVGGVDTVLKKED